MRNCNFLNRVSQQRELFTYPVSSLPFYKTTPILSEEIESPDLKSKVSVSSETKRGLNSDQEDPRKSSWPVLLKKFIEEGADSAARALLSLSHPLLPSFLNLEVILEEIQPFEDGEVLRRSEDDRVGRQRTLSP